MYVKITQQLRLMGYPPSLIIIDPSRREKFCLGQSERSHFRSRPTQNYIVLVLVLVLTQNYISNRMS